MKHKKRHSQFMGPSFPKWTAYLDRPRTVQYSFAAIKRFRSLRGIGIDEAVERLSGLPFADLQREFADLIWVGLDDRERKELPRERIAQFLTVGNLLRMGMQFSRLSAECSQPKLN